MIYRMPTRASLLLLLSAALLYCPQPAFALQPDEIVLIVNSKEPAGEKLAKLYARKRNIPDGRILALDLPFPQEDVAPEVYDEQVVPKVRAFLTDNKLEQKVKCLVTFWGVPLRIARKVTTPADNERLGEIQRAAGQVVGEIQAAVAGQEALAKELDPTFTPKPGGGPGPNQLPELGARAGAATTAAFAKVAAVADEKQRSALFKRWLAGYTALSGKVEALQRMAQQPELKKVAPEPVTPEQLKAAQAAAQALAQKLAKTKANDPEAAKLLKAAKESFGLFRYAVLLGQQRAVIDPTETEAAFDSELSLLWQDQYLRQRWQGNPLHYRAPANRKDAAADAAGTAPNLPQKPVLMVMRLDGPTEPVVRRIIQDALTAEEKGLAGIVALDARGSHGNDGYGQYDKTIRSLAQLLQQKTKLTVKLDDRPELFQPTPPATPDGKPERMKDEVAIYCGWYSLRNYVGAFRFTPGAVGFHIASNELVSLRNPGETGWVANLLNDGVCSSLGPVAEPYLHSFPRADEFFPLLLTGKLTLAEVYWKTNPLTSWMNTCIGDPLYTPFKKDPPLKPEDLPPPLRAAVEAK